MGKIKRAEHVFAGILIVGTMVAQSQLVSAQPYPLPGWHDLNGHVTDAWGNPLEGVRVTLIANGDPCDPELVDHDECPHTFTDGAGRYEFQDEADAEYSMYVERDDVEGVTKFGLDHQEDAVLDFVMRYRARSADQHYETIPVLRTVDGDTTVRHAFLSSAPRPGEPAAAPHTSCAWAQLPSSAVVAADHVGVDPNTGYERFELEHTVPSGTPSGSYYVRWWIGDCVELGVELSTSQYESYIVDNRAPGIVTYEPTAITGPSPTVSIQADEAIDPTTSSLTVDGVAIAPQQPSFVNRLEAHVDQLTSGTHTATFTLVDRAGNVAAPFTFAWSIDADAPVLGAGSPQGVTADRYPTLAIDAADAVAGLDAATATFDISDPRGNPAHLAATHDGAGHFTARRPLPLLLGGWYHVRFEVRDAVGNVQVAEWAFELRPLSSLPR